jgi:hypothetical protein
MPYQPFDIVMLRPELGAKIYAIAEVDPERPEHYIAVRLDRGPLIKRYRLRDDEIWARIGTLEPHALQLDPASVERLPPPDWRLGQHYARYMAEQAPTELERRRWALLASLKPGDYVPLQRRTARGVRIEAHRFQEVLPAGQKYRFTAVNANGTVYRWPLEALFLQPEGGKTLPPGPSTTAPPEEG